MGSQAYFKYRKNKTKQKNPTSFVISTSPSDAIKKQIHP